jgi:hypothetical protein
MSLDPNPEYTRVRIGPGPFGDLLGLFDGFDQPPLVRAVSRRSFGVPIGQTVQIRLLEFGIASATALGHFHEAQGHKFADCWCDCVAVNAVFDEMVVRHRQNSVFHSPVMRVLDLDSSEDL